MRPVGETGGHRTSVTRSGDMVLTYRIPNGILFTVRATIARLSNPTTDQGMDNQQSERFMLVRTPLALGQTARTRREQQGMGLRVGARAANVGTRFLSEMENGKATVQLGKVMDALAAIGLGLAVVELTDSEAASDRTQPEVFRGVPVTPLGPTAEAEGAGVGVSEPAIEPVAHHDGNNRHAYLAGSAGSSLPQMARVPGDLHPETESEGRALSSAKPMGLGIPRRSTHVSGLTTEFPYAWSNANMDEGTLIRKVLTACRFNDMLSVVRRFGFSHVQEEIAFLSDPAQVHKVRQTLARIQKGMNLATTSASAPVNHVPS